ncbi:MAG: hypothetical protein ACT4PO_09530 [Actinomycetota bacterium]
MDQLRAQRRERGETRGTTSDQDQDLLRAMLVFACAGLDAATKALIRDALSQLADAHPPVQERVDDFAAKHLSEGGSVSGKRLAKVLAHAGSPRQAIIEAFVEDLTGGSLQSAEELLRVCDAFGIGDDGLKGRVLTLKEAFLARNEIVHEMDLMLRRGGRGRRTRTIGKMVGHADAIFAVGCDIVSRTSDALARGEAASGEEEG